MPKVIRLEKGMEYETSVYNKVKKYRGVIEDIAEKGQVNIGNNAHKGNNAGARGYDLYNNIRSVLKNALGYEPKLREKLKPGDKTKLEKLIEEADNYSLNLKKRAKFA